MGSGFVILTGLLTLTFGSCRAWEIVWRDEFNTNGAPDPGKWSYDVGDGCPNLCGWGNNEAQTYTDRRDNVRVEGGRLIIEAKRENFGGKSYTAGKIKSINKGDWTFGRFEARIKVPAGKGTWPGFWLLPTANEYGVWPRSGEIDIMEHVGHDQNKIHGTIHWGNAWNDKTQCGTSLMVNTAISDFNDYAVEWTEDEIKFFVNGRQYNSCKKDASRFNWPFNKRFYFVFNLAIGGVWGGQQGIDDAALPARLEVDWVRAYRA